MILKGHHVSKSKTETVRWPAELDTETGRKILTGEDDELQDESISEQFVSEDEQVFDVCQECYSHIKIDGKCVGKKKNQCYLGVSLDW